MTLIPDVFPKLRTPKSTVRWSSKKSCFGGPFEKQHGKLAQTLLKSEREHFYQIYWFLWRQQSRKKSLLVIWEILRLFINTLTAKDKYSLLNREHLRQPIHIQMSQKQKRFSGIFLHFWNLYYIWNIFKKRWPS